jgi:hypothetical protein
MGILPLTAPQFSNSIVIRKDIQRYVTHLMIGSHATHGTSKKIKLRIYIHKGIYYEITLDLPEDLIKEAMKVTNIKTKTKVIITALEQLIRKSKIAEIKIYKEKVDLDIDLNKLRGRFL